MTRFVLVVLMIAVMICFLGLNNRASADAKGSGEEEFNTHCKVCHPDGGNIVNPKKTLHKSDREANNIKTAADIVKTMRNPGLGMQKFDEATIPDAEARKIAEYVLKTFK